ncbi:efflux RND transporter permease subunit [Fusibacter sp. 3D3]|uniref:efflux RND transporter permease subunit n=1 Tax=Fusibacter sp. 3D3 TaxID=1048380 RepID=UPI000853105A|nr:efflux RND transporter permease subunit [Fusibacter sp. 3D3]GAU79164.1 RND multidrug efflux transporter; Acriflavin resistance protein [Fusibacter sp. 3D3]
MKQNEELKSIPELQQPKNILGKWAAFFIDRYKIVYLILVAIVIVGVSAYLGLPRELNPEIVLPYGQVLAVYPGAAPEEVETLVTDVLETKLEEIEDVKMLSSYSTSGIANVWLEFEQGVDMEKKMNEVREKTTAAALEFPSDVETPIVSSLQSNNSPIMIINISGDYDLVTLKRFAEEIKQRLESDNSISEVLIIGGLEREIKVHIDPQKLAVYGITLDQIKTSIALANLNYPGGTATLDEKTYNIRTVGELKSVDALNEVIIAYQGSGPVRIKDIAIVEDGYKEVESYSRMSQGLESESPSMKTAVALSVKKKETADIIKTSELVRSILNNEKGTLYPSDLIVEVSGDTAEFVSDSLGAVTSNALSGLFLVIVVLFLFIGLREAGIVSIVIPLAIMMTLYFLNLAGMTLNTITLFSMVLAVGMLVDNGIVIMENIDRLRGMGLNAKLSAEAGTNQIAPAIMASTLTTLAAFFPIALTPGIMGEFIRSIPITVMFALGSSFLLAITITPALCSRLLAKQHDISLAKPKTRSQISKVLSVLLIVVLSMQAFKDDTSYGLLSFIFAAIFGGLMFAKVYFGKKNKGHHPIVEAYGERLYKIVSKKSKRWTVILVLILAFFTSLSLIPLGLLKVEMFSQTDYERLYVDINTPKGATLEQTNAVVQKVEKILFTYSEIKTFVSNVGITGADSFDSFSAGSGGGTPNIARITIDLCKEEERTRTSMAIAADLREALKIIPGADLEVIELESGPPSGSAVAIGLIGEDLQKMEEVANHFESILETIPGTRDASTSLSSGGPELEISIDKEKAAKFGIDEMTISSTIRNTVSGINATTYRSNQDDIDVMIYSGMDDVQTKGDLESLYFYNRLGQAIRFNQIASFKETATSPTIRHEDGKRRVNVTSQTEADINTVEIVDQFKAKIADYKLPEGISITYEGELGDMQDSFTDMFINMLIAAILVYLILAVQFNSLSQPFIVLFAVPLGLIGVMPGLFLTGNSFGFLAFIGVVALVGIAVNDAIVLVDYINYLRQNGYELLDAVRETGKTRFMPVLATTITTAGGILPLTLKQEFFEQMGFALIFGLMMSTILTLVAIPTLYTMLESFKINRIDKKEKKKSRTNAAETAATI